MPFKLLVINSTFVVFIMIFSLQEQHKLFENIHFQNNGHYFLQHSSELGNSRYFVTVFTDSYL